MAEGHVREAQPTDADEIGRIQSATWQQAYQRQLPASALQEMTPEIASAAWRAALLGASSGQHLLIAIEASATESHRVGFAALAPAAADEEEAEAASELVALLVEPRWGRRGHGSRLLAAAVDAALLAGSAQLITWVLGGDKATESFLTGAGWQRDGWRRTLDAGEREIVQHRMSTSIAHLNGGSSDV